MKGVCVIKSLCLECMNQILPLGVLMRCIAKTERGICIGVTIRPIQGTELKVGGSHSQLMQSSIPCYSARCLTT